MHTAIESLPAVSALPELSPSQWQLSAQASAPGQFASMLAGKVSEMNANVSAAETVLSDLAAGRAVEPQEAMVSMERARISVLTFVQLRNKLIESYQDVMRMQL
ncbi:MAG TPA: flagellar hook-basal body complex protein FliE [Steroidobacteraceae bacterium]